MLPSKNILMFIALICAVLFFANVFRRTWLLPAVGLALLVLSAILLGVLWPGIVQQFQVKPSEPDKEAPYIGKNIEATRAAYDLADTQVSAVRRATTTLTPEQLARRRRVAAGHPAARPAAGLATRSSSSSRCAATTASRRCSTSTATRSTAASATWSSRSRELHLDGLPDAQKNWANEHTVYTHGYGVIAAYGNQQDAEDKPGHEQRRPAGLGRGGPAAQGRAHRP